MGVEVVKVVFALVAYVGGVKREGHGIVVTFLGEAWHKWQLVG